MESKRKPAYKRQKRFEITPDVIRVIKYDYAGISVKYIAQAVNVTQTTIQRWRAQEKYQEALDAYKEDYDGIEDSVLNRLFGVVNDTLIKLLTGRKVSDGVKARMVEMMLKGKGKLVEETIVKDFKVSDMSDEELKKFDAKLRADLRDLGSKRVRENSSDANKRD